MKAYVGMSKGGGKVFQTKRKVTKATFPFFENVVGPFRDKETAQEWVSKHKVRAVRRKVKGKTAKPFAGRGR